MFMSSKCGFTLCFIAVVTWKSEKKYTENN